MLDDLTLDYLKQKLDDEDLNVASLRQTSSVAVPEVSMVTVTPAVHDVSMVTRFFTWINLRTWIMATGKTASEIAASLQTRVFGDA